MSDYLNGIFNDPLYGMTQHKTAPYTDESKSTDNNDEDTVVEDELAHVTVRRGRNSNRRNVRFERSSVYDSDSDSASANLGAGAGVPVLSGSSRSRLRQRENQGESTQVNIPPLLRRNATNSTSTTVVQNTVESVASKRDTSSDGMYASDLFARQPSTQSRNRRNLVSSSNRNNNSSRAARSPSVGPNANHPISHSMFRAIAPPPSERQQQRADPLPQVNVAVAAVAAPVQEEEVVENIPDISYQQEYELFFNKITTLMNRMNVKCPIEGLEAIYEYLKENVTERAVGIAEMYSLDRTKLQAAVSALVARAIVQNRLDLNIPQVAQNNGEDNHRETLSIVLVTQNSGEDPWLKELITNLVTHHKHLLNYQVDCRAKRLPKSTLAIASSDFPVPLNLYGQKKTKQNMHARFSNVVFKILVPGQFTTAIHIQKFLDKNCMVGQDTKCGQGTGLVQKCMSTVYTTPVNENRVSESLAFTQTLRSLQHVPSYQRFLTWHNPLETPDKAYIEELSYGAPDKNDAVFHVVVLTSLNCSTLKDHLNNLLNNKANVLPYNKYNTYLLVVFEPICNSEKDLIKTMYDKVQYIINNIKGPYRGVYFMVGKPVNVGGVDILSNYYEYDMSEHTKTDESTKTNKYRVQGIMYSFEQLHSVYFKDEYNINLLNVDVQDSSEILNSALYHALSLWGITSFYLPYAAFGAEVLALSIPEEYSQLIALADFVSLVGRIYFMATGYNSIKRSTTNLLRWIINSAKNMATVLGRKLWILQETANHEAVVLRPPQNEPAAAAPPDQNNNPLSNRQNVNQVGSVGQINVQHDAYVPLFSL